MGIRINYKIKYSYIVFFPFNHDFSSHWRKERLCAVKILCQDLKVAATQTNSTPVAVLYKGWQKSWMKKICREGEEYNSDII